MKFHRTTLANGLTIIGEERPSAVSAALGFFVKTGARDETAEVSGVSHFLEHMMFKGTDKRTALDINYELAGMGAQANAYTSEERTVYYAAVLPEYVPAALELFSDMLRPKLDVSEFDMEKKVILEEIALYRDRPTPVLFEAALRQYFGGHPAGNSVLGSNESIMHLTQPQMRAYFDRRYSQRNITLAVAGNFHWEAFVSLAEKYCGHWNGEAVSREILPHTATESVLNLHKANMQRSHVVLLSPGPSTADPDRYAAEVLVTMLGDSSGSRVFWELYDKGLADSVSIDNEEMDGTGLLMAYASASPNMLEKVEEILRGIFTTPEKFTDDDLAIAKTKLGTRIVLQAESSMRRLMSIGVDWLERGEYLEMDKEYESIKAVDRKAIGRLIERFPSSPITTVRMLPE